MKNRHIGDIDIDFANRSKALGVLKHTPASIIRNGKIEKHNTGVYFHEVPVDPITGLASVSYDYADNLGWYKIDLLNVSVYEMVENEEHLSNLINQDIPWEVFEYQEFVSKLIHLGNHAELVAALRPTSVEEIAMTLALIRPGKRHLIEKCKLNGFGSIRNEIWTEPADKSYAFKKAHALSYAVLVKVHANILINQVDE